MPRKAPDLCRRKDGRYYLTDPANHRPVYFGRDLPEAERQYGRWIAEFFARSPGVPASSFPGATVYQLVSAYLIHADGYYRKHGKLTSEVNTVAQVAKPLLATYGDLLAADFGPNALKVVRQQLIDADHSRGHINKQMGRVRRIWKWGVEMQMVKPDVLAALQAVSPLARGRTPARETAPIRAVPWEVVEATVPFIPKASFRAMVQVHFWAACRSQDVVRMRPCDIDQSGEVWIYRPWTHKGEHLGLERLVYLGPRCQNLLLPILRYAKPGDWLFPSRGRGRNVGKGPGHLTPNGYRQLAESAVERANVARAKSKLPALPHWFPLQLRHSALTAVRKRYGLEGAQVMGGHANAHVTEIYAERDSDLARKIAAEIG